jgi:hypothetical protein
MTPPQRIEWIAVDASVDDVKPQLLRVGALALRRIKLRRRDCGGSLDMIIGVLHPYEVEGGATIRNDRHYVTTNQYPAICEIDFAEAISENNFLYYTNPALLSQADRSPPFLAINYYDELRIVVDSCDHSVSVECLVV